jgi:hypothetical protein
MGTTNDFARRAGRQFAVFVSFRDLAASDEAADKTLLCTLSSFFAGWLLGAFAL